MTRGSLPRAGADMDRTNWTFNGNVQNLQIFVYGPGETGAAHRSEKEQHVSVKSESESEYTAQEARMYESDPEEVCFENVFMGPLPWHGKPNLWPVKAEQTGSVSDTESAIFPIQIPFRPAQQSSSSSSLPSSPLNFDSNDTSSDEVDYGTPCPVREQFVFSKKPKMTGRTSIYFPKPQLQGSPPLLRQETVRPGCITSVPRKPSKIPKPSKKSAKIGTPGYLQRLERAENHLWTELERYLLICIYRWYEIDWEDTARIFNFMTKLNLLTRVVRHQIDHLRFYGIPHWAVIFQTRFSNPGKRLDRVRALIERYALELDINLVARQTDLVLPPGGAKCSKSPTVKRHLKLFKQMSNTLNVSILQLIRNVSSCESVPEEDANRQTREAVEQSAVEEVFSSHKNTETPQASSQKASRIAVDTSLIDDSLNIDGQSDLKNFPLGFRTWNEHSRTLFDESEGFLADLFRSRNSGSTPPIPWENDHYRILEALALAHLSMDGGIGCSAFVSVSTSLLHTIKLATKITGDAKIALINLVHPSLATQKYYAKDVLKTLRQRRELHPAIRYKGTTEIMVWGQIPKSAIINILSWTELEVLVNGNPHIDRLLRLDTLTLVSQTQQINKKFRKEALQLDTDITLAMGRVTNLLLKPGNRVIPPEQIHLLARLFVDGWGLRCPADNYDRMKSLANDFMRGFSWYGPRRDKILMLDAWINGARKATAESEYWESRTPRRGSGSKARRQAERATRL